MMGGGVWCVGCVCVVGVMMLGTGGGVKASFRKFTPVLLPASAFILPRNAGDKLDVMFFGS